MGECTCFIFAPLSVRYNSSQVQTKGLFNRPSPKILPRKKLAVVRCSYNANFGKKEQGTLTSPKNTEMLRLKQKLATNEDRDWIHKIAGIVHLSTSAILIGNLLFTSIRLGGLLPDIPTSSWFDFVLVSWVMSTLIQGINGAALAVRFRKLRQESAVFVGTGLSSALNAWVAWFSSPHFPSFLHNGPITPLIISSLSFSGIAFTVLACIDANSLTKRRIRHRKGCATLHEIALGNIAYIGPILIGSPLFVGAYRMLVGRGYDGFIGLVSTMPHLDSFGVYNSVLWAVAATIGSFVVTLRDRQIVSPSAERRAIVFSTIIAFVYYMFGMLSLPEWWRLWA